MFDFTLKYFFKEIKKNISMIGVITGAMLLLSLILSMFYNTTLNPPLKTDDLAAFFMELFRLTVILISMLIVSMWLFILRIIIIRSILRY